MDLQTVLEALKRADAAGNAEDARRLAAIAQQLSQRPQLMSFDSAPEAPAPEPPSAPPPGGIKAFGAGLLGGLGAGTVGAGAGIASLVGANETRDSLDAKRKAIQDWQKKYAGDSFAGKVGNVMGGVLPALAVEGAGALAAPVTGGTSLLAAQLINAGFFGIPAARDTYNEEIAKGVSPELAATHAAAAAGIAVAGGQIVGPGGKALGKALGAGEGLTGKAIAAAGEGAAFPYLDVGTHKVIDAVAGHKSDTPFPEISDAAASALGFAGLRAGQHFAEAPGQAKRKAAADAAAAKAAQDAADAAASTPEGKAAAAAQRQSLIDNFLDYQGQLASLQDQLARKKVDKGSPLEAVQEGERQALQKQINDLKTNEHAEALRAAGITQSEVEARWKERGTEMNPQRPAPPPPPKVEPTGPGGPKGEQQGLLEETTGPAPGAADVAAREQDRARFMKAPTPTSFAPDGSPIYSLNAGETTTRKGQLMAALRGLGAMDNPDGTGKIPGLLQDYQARALAATDPAEVAKYSRLYNETLEHTRKLYDEINQLHAAEGNTNEPTLRNPSGYITRMQNALEAAKKPDANGNVDMAAVQQAAEALQKARGQVIGQDINGNPIHEADAAASAYQANKAQRDATDAFNKKNAATAPEMEMPNRDLFGSETAEQMQWRRIAEARAAADKRAAEEKAIADQKAAEDAAAKQKIADEANATEAANEEADSARRSATETLQQRQERLQREQEAKAQRLASATDTGDMFAPRQEVVQHSAQSDEHTQDLRDDLLQAQEELQRRQPGTPEYDEAQSAVRTAQENLRQAMHTGMPPGRATTNMPDMFKPTEPPAATGAAGPIAGRATTESLRDQLARLPRDLHPEDQAIVDRLTDNLDAFASNRARAEAAREWLHRLSLGKNAERNHTAMADDIKRALDDLDAGKRSESETTETKESVAGRNHAMVKDMERKSFLMAEIPKLFTQFHASLAGRKYAHLYNNVLAAMRGEYGLQQRLEQIKDRIEDAEKSLKTAGSPEALDARSRALKQLWAQHERVRQGLDKAQETKRMERIRLYAHGEGTDPSRAMFEKLEQYQTELSQLAQKTTPEPVMQTRRGGAQDNLFGGDVTAESAEGRLQHSPAAPASAYPALRTGSNGDVTTGTFRTPEEFSNYMAGEGLRNLRLALGLSGTTAQRAAKLIEPIVKRIAQLKQSIESAHAAHVERATTRAKTEQQLADQRDAAAVRLNLISERIADELSDYQYHLAPAQENFVKALEASRAVDAQLKQRADLLGAREGAFSDALDALTKAQKALEMATKHADKNNTPATKLQEMQAHVDALSAEVNTFLDSGPKELRAFDRQRRALEKQQKEASDALVKAHGAYEEARQNLLAAHARLDELYGPEQRKSKAIVDASRSGIAKLRAEEAQRTRTKVADTAELQALETQKQQTLSQVPTEYAPKKARESTLAEREAASNALAAERQMRLENKLPAERLSFEGHRNLVEQQAKAQGTADAYTRVIEILKARVAAGEKDPTITTTDGTKTITLASAEASQTRAQRRADRLNRLLDREGQNKADSLAAAVERGKKQVDKWTTAVATARAALGVATRRFNADPTPENKAAQDAATKTRNNAVDALKRAQDALAESTAAAEKGPGIYGLERSDANAGRPIEEHDENMQSGYEPSTEAEAKLLAEGRLPTRRDTQTMRNVGASAGHGFRTGSEESKAGENKTNPRNPPTEVGRTRENAAPGGPTAVEEAGRIADEVASREPPSTPQEQAHAESVKNLDEAETRLQVAQEALARAQQAVDEKFIFKGREGPQRRKVPLASEPRDELKGAANDERANRRQALVVAERAVEDAQRNLERAQTRYDKTAAAVDQMHSAQEGGNSRLIADEAVPDHAITETGKVKPVKKGAGLLTKADREAKSASERAKANIHDVDPTDEDSMFFRGTSGPNDTPLKTGAIGALHKGDVRGALENIARTSTNPVARRIAEQFMKLVGDVKSHVVDEMPGGRPDAPGGTTRNGMNVLFHSEKGLSEETVLHEVGHALTIRMLSVPEHLLSPDQRAAKRELEAMHEEIKRADALDNNVVKDPDIKEFVAEAYGSKQVQAFMRDTPWEYKGNKGFFRNMWDAAKSAFMRLIGAKTPPSGPMHDRFMELAEKFLRTPEKGDAPKGEEVGHLRDPLGAALKHGFEDDRSALGKLKDNKGILGLALRQNLADHRAALREVMTRFGSKDAKADSAFTVSTLDAAPSNTMATLSDGAFKVGKNGMLEVGGNKSFVDVLNDIAKFPGFKGQEAMNLFWVQRVANRADALQNGWQLLAGKDAKKWQDKAQLVRDKLNADPALRKAVEAANKTYNEYNRGKLELLRDSHALPDDVIKAMMADPDYVPFYRTDGDTINIVMPDGHPRSIGDIRTNPMLRALEGGNQHLLGFVEGEVKNAHLLTQLAVTNLAKQHLAKRFEELAKTRVTKQTGAPTLSITSKRLEGQDVMDWREASTGPHDDGKRYLRIDTKGTIAEDIPSTLVAQALAGSYSTPNMFTDMSHAMSNVLRTSVTRFPLYTVKQLFKDSLSASVQGHVSSNPATAIIKSIWEYGRIMANASPEAKKLQAHGIIHSDVLGGSSDLKKVARQITGDKWFTPAGMLRLLDKSAMAADAATRTQAYKDVISKGGSEREALLQAREMQNFSRRGGAAWVQFFNHSIPFFNSSIQSLDTMLRAAKRQMPNEELMNTKRNFAMRAAGMMAMAGMYYAAMEDDPKWKKLSLRDKISYIHLPVEYGGEPIKLPAPFEVGLLFYSLPIALMEHMKHDLSAQDWKTVAGVVANQLPGGSLIPVPQIAKIPLDVSRNYNSSTGKPIIPKGQEGLAPEMQYGPNTTEAARRLGEAAGVSPYYIDYAAKQIAGQWVNIAGSMTESLFRKASEEGIEKPTGHTSDNPIYGSLFQSRHGDTNLDHVYEAAQKSQEASDTFQRMIKTGKGADAKEYMQEHATEIALAKAFKGLTTKLSKLRQTEELIRNHPKMSGEAKQAQLDKIEDARQDIALQYQKLVDAQRKGLR